MLWQLIRHCYVVWSVTAFSLSLYGIDVVGDNSIFVIVYIFITWHCTWKVTISIFLFDEDSNCFYSIHFYCAVVIPHNKDVMHYVCLWFWTNDVSSNLAVKEYMLNDSVWKSWSQFTGGFEVICQFIEN